MNTTITHTLHDKFSRIGSRLKVTLPRRSGLETRFSVDVQVDRAGEYFAMPGMGVSTTEVAVLDVQPTDRHLLLFVRQRDEKSKFLCGHDERHWFVAAIPESAPVGTVKQAKDALKPGPVRLAEIRQRLSRRARDRRKNAAFYRQGEWFFLPKPNLVVDEKLVLFGEPLRRSDRGKPHWVDECFRLRGEVVYACSRYPSGVSAAEYHRLVTDDARATKWGWRTWRRDAEVYVRGRVRHADHATITLPCWHRVLMNTENKARAMQNVAFLD